MRLAGLAGRTVADRAQTRIGRRLGGEAGEAAEHRATGVANALTRRGLLTGKDDTALDHRRLLDFYRAVLADRISPQPFTYTAQ